MMIKIDMKYSAHSYLYSAASFALYAANLTTPIELSSMRGELSSLSSGATMKPESLRCNINELIEAIRR